MKASLRLFWVPSFWLYIVDFCALWWCGLFGFRRVCSTLLIFVFSPGVGCLGFRGFGSTLLFLCSVVVWVVLGSAVLVLPF